MVFPKARLATSAVLFLVWIGFLAFLAARTRNQVILSRPQFFAASLVVRAEIEEAAGRPALSIRVSDVLWSADAGDQALQGANIRVDGIADCLAAHGWIGPGSYLIPLTKRKGDKGPEYEVTPLPVSPGYHPKWRTLALVSVGPNKSALVQALESQGLDASSVEDFQKKKGALVPLILKRNIAETQALQMQKSLEGVEALVRLIPAESRIYPATPEAHAQWKELDSQRRR